jgi:hypothetical protein
MSRASIEQHHLRRAGAYLFAVTADVAARLAQRLRTDAGPTLRGDRWIEWSFCMARIADGPGRTLDFGADIAFLSLAAAQRGHDVVAFDRLASGADYEHPRVRSLQADILTHDFGDQRFDQVLNCSSVEHVGLGGRYGSSHDPEGDLKAMAALGAVLAANGRMVMTIPIGVDQVCAPQHRIYGEKRLPRLLDGYEVLEEQYWQKVGQHWGRCEPAQALATRGSAAFYSLGLFVLTSR